MWEHLMAFCLANALTYSIIFNSQFCFYTKGILEGFFGFYERRTCNSRISKGLYDAVINRLGQQQAYESSRRNLMHFLIQQTRVVVGERVGSLQAFLRIITMHTPYAIYAALHGNFFVCFIHLEFQLHCHVLFQLLFYERGTILQQQLEVSKSSSILYFLYFEIISQHLLLGFPLKCSIDTRTSKIFLFCTANLIFVQGDCSIGCFQGST